MARVVCVTARDGAALEDITEEGVKTWAYHNYAVDLKPLKVSPGALAWTFNTFDSSAKVDKLFKISREGKLRPCARKYLAVTEQQETFVIATVPPEYEIVEVVGKPSKIINIVSSCLTITLTRAKAPGTTSDNAYLFKVEDLKGNDLNNLLGFQYCDDEREDVVVSFHLHEHQYHQQEQQLRMPPVQEQPDQGELLLEHSGPSQTLTHIEIYHDGENCPIPQGEFVTRQDGTLVMEKQDRVKEKPQLKTGQSRSIQFDVLKEALFRRLVEKVEGEVAARQKDLGALSFSWHFIMNFDCPGKWHPHSSVKRDMQVAGVEFVDPGPKVGAVDTRMHQLLSTAETRWRNTDPIEKAGLLIVLISGDSDFAHDVRALRRNSDSPGVDVSIVFSKNGPAKKSFTRLVQEGLVLDDWAAMVEQSRVEGHSSPMSQSAEMGEHSGVFPVSKPKARFLKFPHELAELNRLLGGVHPAYSATLSLQDGKTAVKVSQDSESLDSTTLEHGPKWHMVVDKMDKFLEGAKEKVFEAKGITGQELVQDTCLLALCEKNRLTMFIPNIAGNTDFSLRDKQLFISVSSPSQWKDYQIKQHVLQQCNVKIFNVVRKQGTTYVDIDTTKHSAELNAAKRRLMNSKDVDIRFSNKPFRQLEMWHPANWSRNKVLATLKEKRLNIQITREPCVEPKYPKLATSMITCTATEGDALLHPEKKWERGVSFRRDWQAEGAASPSATPGSAPTVIIVYRSSDDEVTAKLQEVMKYITGLGVRQEEVKMLAKDKKCDLERWRLIQKVIWPTFRKDVESWDVRVSLDENTATATLVGKKEVVELACKALEKRKDNIKFRKVEVPDFQALKETHWHSCMTKVLTGLISDAFRSRPSVLRAPASPSAASAQEQDENTGGDSDGDLNTESDKCAVTPEYFIDPVSGAVKLAYLSEDEDDVEEILDELLTYSKEYTEGVWLWPKQPPHDIAEKWKSFPTKLQTDYNLSCAEWEWKLWRLLLCGRKSDVNEAETWLNNLSTNSSANLAVPKYIADMLRHKKARLERMEKDLKNSCGGDVQVTRGKKTQKTVIFRISGPRLAIDAGRAAFEPLKRALLGELESCSVDLDSAQTDFLKKDGNNLLRELEKKGVSSLWCETGGAEVVLCCQLPNSCRVELRKGDALKGGLEVEAIVNSANEMLLDGDVRGIAGAIKGKGGPALTAECKRLTDRDGPVQTGKVVATGSYGLQDAGFTHVLHAVPPEYTPGAEAAKQMVATVAAILAKADELGLESLVMPILGAGIFGWGTANMGEVAKHILRAIARWSTLPHASVHTLRRIVILDTNPEGIEELAQCMQDFDDRESPSMGTIPPRPCFKTPPEPEHMWEWDDKVGDDMNSDHPWDPVSYDYDQCLQLDNALRTGQLTVLLCGDRQKEASTSSEKEEGQKHARYDVRFDSRNVGEDYSATQFNRKSLHKRKVRKLPLANLEDKLLNVPEFSKLYKASEESFRKSKQEWEDKYGVLGVAVGIAPQDVESTTPIFCQITKAGANTLKLRGFFRNAQEAKEQLLKGLLGQTETSKLSQVFLTAGENLQDVIDSFNEFLSSSGIHADLQGNGENTLVMTTLGKNNRDMAERQFIAWTNQRLLQAVELSARIHYPDEGWLKWDPVDPAEYTEVKFIDIEPDTEEHTEVVRRMRDQTGLGTRTNVWEKKVTKVQRVVNPRLWKRYHDYCQSLKLEPRNNFSANEMWVKHGTGKASPELVCQSEAGVDKNYSQEDGNYFGKATYCAEDATYSDDGGYAYDVPDGITRQMLLCRFAAGTIAQMTQSSETLTLKHPPEYHDSVRGDVMHGNGSYALVAYRDYQIYPHYVVSYEKEK